jgi:hypothetical protein
MKLLFRAYRNYARLFLSRFRPWIFYKRNFLGGVL